MAFYPGIAFLVLRDGREIRAWGIQASQASPRAAQELVDSMNRFLQDGEPDTSDHALEALRMAARRIPADLADLRFARLQAAGLTVTSEVCTHEDHHEVVRLVFTRDGVEQHAAEVAFADGETPVLSESDLRSRMLEAIDGVLSSVSP